MKHIHPLLPLLVGLLFPLVTYGNDGVFYMKGTQLVPMHESTISLKKEVLKIRRVEGFTVEVTVDFTFFNPGEEKVETVGFVYPSLDHNESDIEPEAEYLSDFKTTVNGEALGYTRMTLPKSDYGLADELPLFNSYEVNYFKMRFKKGENKVLHTYHFMGGMHTGTEYEVQYILTTGKRWANNQIDDFTLILDMGDDAVYDVEEFSKTPIAWSALRMADAETRPQDARKLGKRRKLEQMEGNDYVRRWQTIIQANEPVTFHAKNFKPSGEIRITGNYNAFIGRTPWREKYPELPEGIQELYEEEELFNHIMVEYYALGHEGQEESFAHFSSEQLRFMRNLPFARKGHVFQDVELDKVFRQFDWYIPRPDQSVKLSATEQTYVSFIKGLDKTNASKRSRARQLADICYPYFKKYVESGEKSDDEAFSSSLQELSHCSLKASAADAAKNSEHIIGIWQSTRHPYLFEASGRWSVLPEFGTTAGSWSVDGNIFKRTWDEPAENETSEIILLDEDYFITKDTESNVFFRYRSELE